MKEEKRQPRKVGASEKVGHGASGRKRTEAKKPDSGKKPLISFQNRHLSHVSFFNVLYNKRKLQTAVVAATTSKSINNNQKTGQFFHIARVPISHFLLRRPRFFFFGAWTFSTGKFVGNRHLLNQNGRYTGRWREEPVCANFWPGTAYKSN